MSMTPQMVPAETMALVGLATVKPSSWILPSLNSDGF
jgi:hypothetical protein